MVDRGNCTFVIRFVDQPQESLASAIDGRFDTVVVGILDRPDDSTQIGITKGPPGRDSDGWKADLDLLR